MGYNIVAIGYKIVVGSTRCPPHFASLNIVVIGYKVDAEYKAKRAKSKIEVRHKVVL